MVRLSRMLGIGLAALAFAVWLGGASPARPQAPSQPSRPAGDRLVKVQEALTLPFDFPFTEPVPLEKAVAYLSKQLNAPVALDRAALERLDVRADDTVQLELKGVRLKTGLKLLLDQLDLTYRVEPEDNLLIITDQSGAEDPLSLVLEEIESLHKDIHEVQDAVEEIRAAMGLGQVGERVRKPTIIEELPPGGTEKPTPKSSPSPSPSPSPSTSPPARSRPGL